MLAVKQIEHYLFCSCHMQPYHLSSAFFCLVPSRHPSLCLGLCPGPFPALCLASHTASQFFPLPRQLKYLTQAIDTK